MYNNRLDIRRIKRYIYVYTYDGITVKWDGDSYVSVALPQHYKNKVCGLCGNFNDDVKDEFTLPNGLQVWLFHWCFLWYLFLLLLFFFISRSFFVHHVLRFVRLLPDWKNTKSTTISIDYDELRCLYTLRCSRRKCSAIIGSRRDRNPAKEIPICTTDFVFHHAWVGSFLKHTKCVPKHSLTQVFLLVEIRWEVKRCIIKLCA